MDKSNNVLLPSTRSKKTGAARLRFLDDHGLEDLQPASFVLLVKASHVAASTITVDLQTVQ